MHSSLSGQSAPPSIAFYAPGLKRYETYEFKPRHPHRFLAISLTGGQCALQCDHCRGKLLEAMLPLRDGLFSLCQPLAVRGTRGVLISGGSDSQGRVPLEGYLGEMGRVKRELGLKVLVHTGLVDEGLARGLREAGVDGAMLDLIGAPETLRQVYHLRAGVGEVERSLHNLAEHGVPAMPHIVLGLHYGQMRGEGRALRMAARYPIACLVLVVLTPLPDTPMAGVSSPPQEEIGTFFQEARALLPSTPLLLGCARPFGQVRRAIERLAIDAGFNGIAYPSPGTVRYARKKGLKPRFSELCCALPEEI